MADETTGAAVTQPNPAEEPMEVKTSTGQVFKGTKDEIIAAMQGSVESGSTTLRQMKEANETLTRSLESVRYPEVVDEPAPQGTFDSKKYFDLLSKGGNDTLDAIRMADEALHGEPITERYRKLEVAYQRALEVGGLMEIQRFQNMVGTEYPGTKEVADAIWKQAGFDRQGAVVTASGMLTAYTELKQAGVIKTNAPAAVEPTRRESPKAPPSAHGTGGPERITETDMRRISKMTPEQIKAEMEKLRGTSVQ